MPYTEEQLIHLLKDKRTRRQGFERVVTQYSPSLYALIRRMVLLHDDADDVLQDTFLKAWSNLDSFRFDSKLSTWLYRIAYNECLLFLRRQKNTVSLDSDEAEGVELLMSDDYFDGDQTQLQLLQAVNQLPEKQRVIFNMKYFQEMKYEDISDILGTTVGGLKASYHIAVKKIEEFFNQHN